MMGRTVQTVTRQRSFFGKLVKWIFIGFNLLMIFWLITYWADIGGMVGDSMSDAEAAGAAIGGTIGTGLLLMIWVLGDIILGIMVLLTRGKTIVTTDESTS